MKKIFLVVSLMCSFLVLSGCEKKVSTENFKNDLIEFNTNLKSYFADVTLEIHKDDDFVTFDCEVYYLKDNYYKVIMKDNSTNNTQAIVKNDEGVFVLTPLLNKQFKFSNDWPLNSSHAYLFQSIVKDITNDEASTVLSDDDNFVVTSRYSSKSNASLISQKATFTKNFKPLYCVVMNESEQPLIKATFNQFIDNYSLKPNDFNTEAINTSIRLEYAEGSFSQDLESVKPTYAPEGSALTTTVNDTDYVIYNYNDYTITTNFVEEDETLTTYRTYEDLVVSSNGILSTNSSSIAFYQGNVLVTIYSETIGAEEMFKIADSF